MAGDWVEARLGDLAEIYDGPHATPTKTTTGPVFLGISSLVDGRLDLSDTAHVSETDFERWTRRVTPQPGDVVFSYETRLGEAALVPPGLRCCLGRRMGLLRAREERVDSRFLLYAYLAPEFQQTIRSRTIHGSTVDRIPLIEMPGFPIRVPKEIQEQRAISEILGSLDDKIALNRRMNETLEALAQALFKSWFVDFDPVRAKASGEAPESISNRLGLSSQVLALFPDSLVNSDLGEIPEGWRISTVDDVSLKVGMGPFGSNIKVSTFVEDGIPVISGQHLNGTLLEDATFNFITTEHADRLASSNVGRGDIVLTHRGNIGQVSYIPDRSRFDRYVVSQSQFFVRSNDSKISPVFMTYYFRSAVGQHNLLANASQVGVPSIASPVTYLKSIELVVPSKAVTDEFDHIIRSLHHRISTSRIESMTLAGLRDSLLPKLLSGAVRAPIAGET